ncbi:sodium/hydrogen exchanger 11 [Saccopteryx leptura]|uniref:sodium/hydrogen exchanger 11 n=1 Tax=Saccopteryx leptura TaxID=249018 RepID=UPI00339C5815
MATLTFSFLHIITAWTVVVRVSELAPDLLKEGLGKAVAKMNSTWMMKDTTPQLLCGRSADYSIDKEYFVVLMFSIIFLTGLLRVFLRISEVSILTILSIVGFVIGQLAYSFLQVHQIVHPLLKTPSFSLYAYVAPLIIFKVALEVDFYVLKNMLWKVVLIGFIGSSTAFIVIGYVVMKFNKDSWNLQCCLLFSMIAGMLDPINSVLSLKTIGSSKMYTDIIRGESMIMCGVAYILLATFRNLKHMPVIDGFSIFVNFTFVIFGSILFGYLFSRIVRFLLNDQFNNTLTNVIYCFSMVYLTFYVVEFFKMSGMVALITVGLNLDSLSFRPKTELVITKFLMLFLSMFQPLLYVFWGIVIGCGERNHLKLDTVTFMFLLFVTLNVVRALTVVLVSPILRHLSSDYDWRWGTVIAWSGIKGIFNLFLAPEMYSLVEKKAESPEVFLLYTQILSLMTLGINSYMMTSFARQLGLCAISLPRQMAIQSIIKHIEEIRQNTITLSKTEKLLTNVNWTLVEEKTKIEYSIPFHDISHGKHEQESLTDEVLMEEARLHVARIQMNSFENQCHEGILNAKAARMLIGATKSFSPIHGKFMSIYDVSTYVKAKSWLIKFKNILTMLDYHKNMADFFPSGNNRFQTYIYYIVASEEFEYAGNAISFMYIFPMIMHLWPMARELNVSSLILVNYYFIFLYVLQSVLKVIIMKRKYFYQHWNIVEFCILLIGIADISCIYFVRMRPSNMILIQITIILGYFRIIRFIPLIKVIIPLLVIVVDVQLKKRGSLMYTITKGYVKSQEDTKLLIKQISSRESVYQKLYEILETNRRDGVKELGLIERECRDVVIALKTKQAVRTVISRALKELTFQSSRGIIDHHEVIEVNKVLLSKIKELNKLPMAIPPPPPEKYLHNIVWLENKDTYIEFFKNKARLAYFEYGSVMCQEGEMAKGIYLIISGMAVLHSSSPTFGIDSGLGVHTGSQTMFTEYCTSGDLIGELSCLLKRELQYTAICETVLQACFISLEDLYEGFDAFWPILEYKIWLKLALDIARQYFESVLVDEDLKFHKCVTLSLAYVETLSDWNEMTIDKETMKFVIVVYGGVTDKQTNVPYLAPCILPTACEQVRGTSGVNKLLVIQASGASQKEGQLRGHG